MKVRRLDDIIGTDRDVLGHDRDVAEGTWRSRRLLLADDRVGFSMHDTVLFAGTETSMWYANHIEAVYVIEGEGELVDHETGDKHRLSPGTLYLLDGHERHTLHAHTDVRTVCVFNPPVTGREVHDENGVYPLLTETEDDQ
ncbi:ectoine synthase [Stackebrandtia endophytica]|uniref:L-ectoine synthase n=1 Tax=Stackebrandtia endophytica TaxID=1496996 RepID=A0A543AUF8_9ACTN|nr:ectoine synthase [Stackebrandtia endophytica]TQL76213.1 ectoine synthase [Stackebrandtia endophytica]